MEANLWLTNGPLLIAFVVGSSDGLQLKSKKVSKRMRACDAASCGLLLSNQKRKLNV